MLSNPYVMAAAFALMLAFTLWAGTRSPGGDWYDDH